MFITFEGPDGSGKTTQSKLLKEYLETQGKTVLWTREPGGSDLGKEIRKILLDNRELEIVPVAELLLFCADRAQHVAKIIKPALARGEVVICDRFVDSTMAYQAGGRGFDEQIIKILNDLTTLDIIPDVTFLIDIDSKLGLKRATKNGMDKFEQEDIDFHKKVREKYLKIAKNNRKFRIIDGSESVEKIFLAIKFFFEELI